MKISDFWQLFLFGENIDKFNIFYPFLKRTLKTYKSFDSLFHVLFLTKEVKSSGGSTGCKKGGSYLMNRARHKLEEAAHSYYAQYIVIFYVIL